MPIQTLIAAMLAIALHSPAAAQSRRDSRGPSAPPPVVSQTVAVERGGKITVPLAIHGTRGELLEFLIRMPPSHGKLSAVHGTGMNSATVSYTPSTRSGATEDRFAYAVRGSEGVSAPGLITIRIAEPYVAAPKLRAPGELEFPPVLPGQLSTVEMELANEGGGTIEGEVTVPEPWTIDGVRIFKISAGRTATFRLVFTPAQAGVRTGEADISGTEKRIVLLRASAEERLVATPALLKLTAQRGSQTRMGVLKIGNHSPEDATVLVEAGARLMTDRTVRVPAHGTSAVPVFADAKTAAAFDDTVTLSSKEWKATVPVHVVAVGVILKFTGEEVGITGSAPAGAVAILENSGGEPATVRLDVGRPFEVGARVVTAPARGRVEIPLLLRGSEPGTFRSTLKATGEGGSAVIPVMAEIPQPQPERKAARPQAAAEEGKADTAPQDDASPLIPREAREVPNALGKFGRGTGVDSARLEWPAELGAMENLRVEERVLSFATGDELQVGWTPLANVSFTPAGERMTAELRGLRPATLYTVRVVTAADTENPVLFTTDFQTAARKPFYTGSLLTPLLVVALIILAWAIWRSRRAQQPARK